MREIFDALFSEFKAGELWKAMEETVEDSPWHREANVAVHTQMVIDQVDVSPFELTERERFVVKLIAMFHDVGKPAAQEVLFREDGTKYRRYAGHELISGVLFMDEYVGSAALQQHVGLTTARAIRWVLENHLPYGLTDKQKVNGLMLSAHQLLADAGLSMNVFWASLLADCCGRISDDHAEKIQKVKVWIEEMQKYSIMPMPGPAVKQVILMCGPSGSGKTTFIKQHFSPEVPVYSRDDYIIEYYKASPVYNGETRQVLYDKAWQYATSNEFEKAFKERLHHMLKSNTCVIVDMTNCSKKARGKTINVARQFGFSVHAIEFWVSWQIIERRNNTRERKIPPLALFKQFMMCSVVAPSEADYITSIMA
jgi:predicted kinase